MKTHRQQSDALQASLAEKRFHAQVETVAAKCDAQQVRRKRKKSLPTVDTPQGV